MGACGQGQQSSTNQSEIPILPADGMQDFGDYVLYANALTTDSLDADIAREYEIVRSRSRALLTFSVHRKQQDGTTAAVRGEVSSSAINLTGQLKNVLLREITEGDAIYYIGELQVFDGETLTYTINVIPNGGDTRLSVRYQKRFFTDG